jgi:hypothetical protein
VGDPGSRTGRPGRSSCSCSTPGAGGGTCPRPWAAGPGTPPGVDCASGRRSGSGGSSTGPCSRRSPRGDPRLVAGEHRCGVRTGPKRGELIGPSPTHRGKPGTKYHLLTDRNGLPLHVLASGANTHDSKLFEPLLETSPAVRGRRGRPGRPRRPGRRSCMRTRATTIRGAAVTCIGGASRCRSPGAGSRPGPTWAGTAGWWSAPSPGCCGSSAWGCATTAPKPHCYRFFCSPSRSSTSADCARQRSYETGS